MTKDTKMSTPKWDENKQSYIVSYKGPIEYTEKRTASEWQMLLEPPWSNGPHPHYQ